MIQDNMFCHTMGTMYPYGMKDSAVMTDEDLSFAGGEVDSSMGFTLVLDALHKVEGIKNANQALILSKIYSLFPSIVMVQKMKERR